jgi:hypothetical protein
LRLCILYFGGSEESDPQAQEELDKLQKKELEMEQFEETQLRVGLKESKSTTPNQHKQDDPVSKVGIYHMI